MLYSLRMFPQVFGMAGGCETDNSNAMEAIHILEEKGFQSAFAVVDALTLGIPQSRKRIFFLGIHVRKYAKMLGLPFDNELTNRVNAMITQWRSTIDAVMADAESWPRVSLDLFLLPDSHPVLASAASSLREKVASTDTRNKGGRPGATWKKHHTAIFKKHNLTWSPVSSRNDGYRSNDFFNALPEREQDSILLHDITDPVVGDGPEQELSTSAQYMYIHTCIRPHLHRSLHPTNLHHILPCCSSLLQ